MTEKTVQGLHAVVRVTTVISCVFLTASCASITTDFATGQQTRNMFTVQEDIELGNKTFDELTAQMAKDGTAVVSKNMEETERVRTIANRIFDASGCREIFDFDVVLFESKVVNAFAVPGGKIAVFSGLWNDKDGLVTDDDELAAVIAHEVAHVTCRHSTEEMTRQMPTQLLLAAAGLYAESQENDDVKAVVGSAFLIYNGLVVPKYSRTNEFEADRNSMQYMAKAGYDPAACVRLWKRAYEKEGGTPGYLSILSTHPSNQARYEALQNQLPRVLAMRDGSSGSSPLLGQSSGGDSKDAAPTSASPPLTELPTTASAKAIRAVPASSTRLPSPTQPATGSALPVAPKPPHASPPPSAPMLPQAAPLPALPALPQAPRNPAALAPGH